MPAHDELVGQIRSIATSAIEVRQGRVIPTAEDVALATGARQFQATFAYADLVDSTRLAAGFQTEDVARIYKAFLATATRIFRLNRGAIRSFDGDRVLAVFLGEDAEVRAVRSALLINGILTDFTGPALRKTITFLGNASYEFQHRVGIDAGTVTAIRVGGAMHNDLSWIGKAPNIAAKLAALPVNFGKTVVSADVYGRLPDNFRWRTGVPIWVDRVWDGPLGRVLIYGSNEQIGADISPFVGRLFQRWLYS